MQCHDKEQGTNDEAEMGTPAGALEWSRRSPDHAAKLDAS